MVTQHQHITLHYSKYGSHLQGTTQAEEFAHRLNWRYLAMQHKALYNWHIYVQGDEIVKGDWREGIDGESQSRRQCSE